MNGSSGAVASLLVLAADGAGVALIIAGGPIRDESINGQPFVVYPLTLRATEGTPQTYIGGPTS